MPSAKRIEAAIVAKPADFENCGNFQPIARQYLFTVASEFRSRPEIEPGPRGLFQPRERASPCRHYGWITDKPRPCSKWSKSRSRCSNECRAIASCSWTPEESQVESCEHQDNANIHCQPFPESVSEEDEIYTDYDGCHRHHVKHDNYLSAHFSLAL